MQRVFTIIFMLIILVSCALENKQTMPTSVSCYSGHILFIYVGDANHPIEPLILHTFSDTTYLQYRDRDPRSIFWIFNSYIGYSKENIDIIDTVLYAEIKNKLIEYKNTSNTDNSFYFQIIAVNGCDSISTKINKGDSAFSFFSNLKSLAKENNLENATERFDYYKKMQIN